MIYEGQICRGPMERSSFMLPDAVGCSYNRCRFCNLFKHLKYRQLPREAGGGGGSSGYGPWEATRKPYF